ncbi:restriction endonuclease [Ramlibacter sp.]|uniref:restriction endonuclease n=1 Tax=Ramlibacter sp. TaxID=1917967 RepID=UPI003D097B21
MARRRNSGAEALLNLVAMLPWWVGLLLAIASYFVLERLSRLTSGVPVQGQLAASIQVTMLAAFGSIGKVVVPALCVVAAAVSFARRRRRAQLMVDATGGGTHAISTMSWREFEAFVSEVFRERGYSVAENFDGGADGGYDLKMRKNGELALVQCKQWKAFKVGVTVVRELYGVMAASGASEGYVVTSGAFTSDAVAFAEGRNIQLWDGKTLSGLLSQQPEAPMSPPPTVSVSPMCPKCGSGMKKRAAKAGANAGKMFWGCSRFPACRGTREG